MKTSSPTSEQQVVIDSKADRIVVIAGPGSGKSQVLLWRIERLIRDGIDPAGMVAITFTNAAADDLKKRLSQPIGFCGTVHSFLLKLLQSNPQIVGFPHTRLTVLDEEATETLIDEQIRQLNHKGSRKAVTEALGRPFAISGSLAQLVAGCVYKQMRLYGMVSYDAILHFGKLWIEKSDAAFPCRYLFWDEGHDCTDFELGLLLAMPVAYRFMICDPDQATYGWRGAHVENLLRVLRGTDWTAYVLQQSFRCGSEIAAAANKLISHNQDRYPKEIKSSGQDACVLVRAFATVSEEVDYIVATQLDFPMDQSVAVLLRTNALVEDYRHALRSAGIPVTSEPPLPSDWLKTVLFLSLLSNPKNDYLALQWLKLTIPERKAAQIAVDALRCRQSINSYHLLLPINWSAYDVLGHPPEWMSDAMILLLTSAVSGLPKEASINDLLLKLREKKPPLSEGVQVLTYHSSKGREFDAVFLPAFESHILPGDHRDSEEVSEDRRLTFVGLTRAKEAVFITWARERVREYSERGRNKLSPSQPSRFLAEMGF